MSRARSSLDGASRHSSLSQPDCRIVVGLNAGGPEKLGRDWIEGGIFVIRRAEVGQWRDAAPIPSAPVARERDATCRCPAHLSPARHDLPPRFACSQRRSSSSSSSSRPSSGEVTSAPRASKRFSTLLAPVTWRTCTGASETLQMHVAPRSRYSNRTPTSRCVTGQIKQGVGLGKSTADVPRDSLSRRWPRSPA